MNVYRPGGLGWLSPKPFGVLPGLPLVAGDGSERPSSPRSNRFGSSKRGTAASESACNHVCLVRTGFAVVC